MRTSPLLGVTGLPHAACVVTLVDRFTHPEVIDIEADSSYQKGQELTAAHTV